MKIHYKQLDAMDCGPTCLRMVAKYYGKSYSLQYLRSHSYITREGVSMLGISEAAENIGFRTKGYRLTWEELRDEVPLPCIVHWKQRILWWFTPLIDKDEVFPVSHRGHSPFGEAGREAAIVHVADPALGLLTYTKDEFLNCWLSTKTEGEKEGALLLEPTPDFYKHEDEEKGKLKFMYLLGYLRPYRKVHYPTWVGHAHREHYQHDFSVPYPVGGRLRYWQQRFGFYFYGAGGTNGAYLRANSQRLIRSWIMLHVTTRISISLITDFLIKLMKLPIAFFDIKMIGDIMQRIQDHNRIQSFLTKSLIDIVFAVITLVFMHL
jgi:ATP-binding cassette, subfamily B, bacterial